MPRRTRPIITLTSDFGTRDAYVAQMKGVLLGLCPEATLVDVTHNIDPHDILAGSIALERAVAAFPRGTIHIAVVDPGVGTDRRILLTSINGQTVLCPDNGLITWTWRRFPGGKAFALDIKSPPASRTFHGRDILAPAAGKLAAGGRVAKKMIHDPLLLRVWPADRATRVGIVIHIDSFGNAMTNLSPGRTKSWFLSDLRVKKTVIRGIKNTYADVDVGQTLALIGSSGFLEIAVRDGSAAKKLKLKVGDEVRLV